MNFDELYKQHYSQVRKTVAKYLHVEEDIDDVTQEVFLKAYCAMDSFSGNASVATWLTRIAMNEAINFVRRSKKEAGVFVDTKPEDSILDVAIEDSPEHLLYTQEAVKNIQDYLNKMNEKHLEVLFKREVEGQSYKTISEEMNVPVNTAKTWVKRSKEQIKSFICP